MRIFGLLLKKCIKQTIVYVGILFVISVILTQIGIGKLNSIYQEEKQFENLEDQLVERYINYHQYGGYGIRLKFSPEPIAALFVESSPFLNINSFIDIGVRLYVYNELSPDKAFDQNGYLDLLWFLTVVGSLLVSIWGWNTHNDEDRMKFLISVDSRSIFKWKLLSRLTLIFMVILVIYGQILMQFLINGYSIDIGYLGILLGVVYLVYIGWLLLAAFMGCGDKKKRKIIFGIIWFVIVMLLPEIVKIYFDREAKVILTCKYNHEQKMVEILMRFEKKAFAKAARLKTKEEKFKVSVESAGEYLKIDSKDLERLQKNLLKSVEKEMGKYNFICQFTPMTWLKTIAIEISSQGFRGYQRFFLYSLSMQMKFLKFIMDKLYLKAPNYGPVHSFQKRGENIFRFKSTLPGYFLLGVLWHIALVLILIWLNYLKFSKLMFKDEREKVNDSELTINKGVINILLTAFKALKEHLFSGFAGKSEFKGNLTINSKKVEGSRDFIYLYNKGEMEAEFLPDEIKKLLNEPGNENENWKVIFNHAKKKNKVLILDEFFNEVKEEDIEVILEEIKKNKILALIITGDQYFAFEYANIDNIHRMTNDNSVAILKKLEKRLKK